MCALYYEVPNYVVGIVSRRGSRYLSYSLCVLFIRYRGLFFRRWSSRDVKVNTRLHLLPRLRINCISCPPCACVAFTGKTLPFFPRYGVQHQFSAVVLPVQFKLALGWLSDICAISYTFRVKLVLRAIANSFVYPSASDIESNNG